MSRRERIDKMFFPFNAKFARECKHVDRLAEVMAISKAEAAAYIAFLMAFCFVYGNAEDDGTIEHLNPFEVEAYCLWQGEKGGLIRGFIDAGVLYDNPLRVASDGLWDVYFEGGLKAKRAADRERRDRNRKKQAALAEAAIKAGLTVETIS